MQSLKMACQRIGGAYSSQLTEKQDSLFPGSEDTQCEAGTLLQSLAVLRLLTLLDGEERVLVERRGELLGAGPVPHAGEAGREGAEAHPALLRDIISIDTPLDNRNKVTLT